MSGLLEVLQVEHGHRELPRKVVESTTDPGGSGPGNRVPKDGASFRGGAAVAAMAGSSRSWTYQLNPSHLRHPLAHSLASIVRVASAMMLQQCWRPQDLGLEQCSRLGMSRLAMGCQPPEASSSTRHRAALRE